MRLSRPDGTELWYGLETDGDPDAPAAVLLPGRGDDADLFPAEFRRELVAAGLRVVRFDPRDTGLSDDGGDAYSMATMADDALAVLDAAVGGVAAHWIGVSMAGLHLVDLALRHPERVTSLTFVSAISPDPDAGTGEHFFDGPPGDDVEVLVAMMGRTTDEDRTWAARHVARSRERAAVRPDASDAHMAAVGRSQWPTLDDLRRIHRPTLVVHGTDDRTLPLAHARSLAQDIAGGELLIRNGMGHLPRPADWAAIACEVEVMAARC